MTQRSSASVDQDQDSTQKHAAIQFQVKNSTSYHSIELDVFLVFLSYDFSLDLCFHCVSNAFKTGGFLVRTFQTCKDMQPHQEEPQVPCASFVSALNCGSSTRPHSNGDRLAQLFSSYVIFQKNNDEQEGPLSKLNSGVEETTTVAIKSIL